MKKTTKNNDKKINDLMSMIILIIGATLVLIPVLWMISTSLKIEAETLALPPRWIPENITFEAYKRLWTEYPFVKYFFNSAFVVAGSICFTVTFSTLAGYGVTRFKFKCKEAFISFLLVSQMFPSVMLVVPYYKMLSIYGLNDSLTGLTLVYIAMAIPFSSWLMIGYFKTIPTALDEAGIIDGCNRLQVFIRIIMPLSKPGIVTAAIYAFIGSWNDYMFAQTLINSPNNRTLPLGIAELNGYYKILWNDLMAASVLASIPVILLFLLLQKHFVGSLTSGAVK